MENASPAPQPTLPPQPNAPPRSDASAADAAMTTYVGLLAGWFDIGQLAAGRRLERAGVRGPLLNDP
jgi:hypothetical protein